tara:strand:- start:384 stop:959 length:576 start_codon:yes stop_codon:yes gene_type:complete
LNQPYSEILEIAKRLGALQFGQFTLSSGAESKYYFDGRLLTLDPEGASLIARAFMPILIDCKTEAIAGPTLGADPIVAAVAVTSHLIGKPIPGLIVRKEAKNHGGGRVIEGPLIKGSRVAVVDDACTSGSSLIHAIQMIEDAGCMVVKVLCVLDRLEGGSTEIKSRGYEFASLLEYNGSGEIVPSSKVGAI